MKQRWRLLALWGLPLLLAALLGWQILSGGASRFRPTASSADGTVDATSSVASARNTAVARMSYGRFLDYVKAGRVTAVDIFDGGRTAVIEAVDPDLDNRVQRLRVDLPGVARRGLRPRAASGPGGGPSPSGRCAGSRSAACPTPRAAG